MLTTTFGQQFTSSLPCRSSNLEISSISKTVSLIIVNYNSGNFLLACVSSALSQVDEVVVVDNASRDHSLLQLEAAFPSEPKLLVVQNRKNLGFAAGCNIGSKQGTGKYLLFLNPDCVLEPGSVKQLLETLERCPDVGMVGGFLMNPDGTEQAGGRRAVPTP